MAPVMTIEQLEARQTEIRSRLTEIDSEAAGQALGEEARSEWDELNGELEANDGLIKELRVRRERIEQLAGREENRETEPTSRRGTSARESRVPDNVFDVAEYRSRSRNDDELRQALRDGAMRVVEAASFAHPDAKPDEQRERIQHLLDNVDDETGTFARRVLQTSDPAYVRGFAKHLAGKPLTTEEQRALGIGSSGQGGNYPVPIVLDPTVILTSNGQVNPLRQIARVETIVGNTWNGVASAGITASYGAEATEAGDNSPTLTQPSANVEKAQAFVPFSIEAGEDWGSLQSEMARLLQDAKDALEATKFLSGAGHGSNEPQGLLVGGTATVSSAATATFAVADLYAVVEGLPERWQPGASILAHRHQLNKVRQFDTAGGASLWVQLGNGYPSRLLDYPTFNYSAMSNANTSNASILTIGDFSQFLILDRIGMEIELIPHLFGTANNRPTGQRGLYAYWRNTSLVTAVNAFKTLKLL